MNYNMYHFLYIKKDMQFIHEDKELLRLGKRENVPVIPLIANKPSELANDIMIHQVKDLKNIIKQYAKDNLFTTTLGV
ncbi:uncharacterized protein METZ01_LOCUS350665 [marine metagenome]|uniref:Uncharacterized protein n=1 Tax=marine metagenome TaxID=408172 RepID=A0A382RMG5_9ZZZZ